MVKLSKQEKESKSMLTPAETSRLTQLFHTFRGLSTRDRMHPDYRALREEKAALDEKAALETERGA